MRMRNMKYIVTVVISLLLPINDQSLYQNKLIVLRNKDDAEKRRKMQFKFKEDNSFEKRKAEATNIRSQHPDRVPVIIEKAPDSSMGNLDKNKFLVPQDITMSQLMYIIRKRIKLAEDKALFLSVNQSIPSTSITVGEVFDQHRDEDGFLYLTFRGENTFGH